MIINLFLFVIVLIKNFVKTILKISLKAKSINENKYNHIIKLLDAYVNNNQNDLDNLKKEMDHLIFMMINN